MPDVIIENPILNSPFAEPGRHFRFSEDGITNDVVESQRKSAYFMPIAKAKKKGKQLVFDTEWTGDRLEPNPNIDRIRERVGLWRRGNYAGVTPTTRRLLAHWTDPERENKLFFCQIEALETAIYIAEVANKFGDGWIADMIRQANDTSNPGLPRQAFKMATGAGKTVVMAMLIAWQALNKFASPQDSRFTDTFLVITPGITIKDRLRVLLPNDPDNYYRLRDIVPGDMAEQLNRAKILITNYHGFLPREKLKAPRLTKKMANPGGPMCSRSRRPKKVGKLGEGVRCVVSVSMLTEGWDANTVTHTLPEVVAYVKNQNLGFTIPYTIDGAERDYYPDFIAVIDLNGVHRNRGPMGLHRRNPGAEPTGGGPCLRPQSSSTRRKTARPNSTCASEKKRFGSR